MYKISSISFVISLGVLAIGAATQFNDPPPVSPSPVHSPVQPPNDDDMVPSDAVPETALVPMDLMDDRQVEVPLTLYKSSKSKRAYLPPQVMAMEVSITPSDGDKRKLNPHDLWSPKAGDIVTIVSCSVTDDFVNRARHALGLRDYTLVPLPLHDEPQLALHFKGVPIDTPRSLAGRDQVNEFTVDQGTAARLAKGKAAELTLSLKYTYTKKSAMADYQIVMAAVAKAIGKFEQKIASRAGSAELLFVSGGSWEKSLGLDELLDQSFIAQYLHPKDGAPMDLGALLGIVERMRSKHLLVDPKTTSANTMAALLLSDDVTFQMTLGNLRKMAMSSTNDEQWRRIAESIRHDKFDGDLEGKSSLSAVIEGIFFSINREFAAKLKADQYRREFLDEFRHNLQELARSWEGDVPVNTGISVSALRHHVSLLSTEQKLESVKVDWAVKSDRRAIGLFESIPFGPLTVELIAFVNVSSNGTDSADDRLHLQKIVITHADGTTAEVPDVAWQHYAGYATGKHPFQRSMTVQFQTRPIRVEVFFDWAERGRKENGDGYHNHHFPAKAVYTLTKGGTWLLENSVVGFPGVFEVHLKQ